MGVRENIACPTIYIVVVDTGICLHLGPAEVNLNAGTEVVSSRTP